MVESRANWLDSTYYQSKVLYIIISILRSQRSRHRVPKEQSDPPFLPRPKYAPNRPFHCVDTYRSVIMSSLILQPFQANSLSRLTQLGKHPISFELPRLPFFLVCHLTSQLDQAICFKNGESSSSLALGRFSWSISNVLLRNSWPSSLAFSGVVGFALEFPI